VRLHRKMLQVHKCPRRATMILRWLDDQGRLKFQTEACIAHATVLLSRAESDRRQAPPLLDDRYQTHATPLRRGQTVELASIFTIDYRQERRRPSRQPWVNG
jgi:hypothetical protein